MPDDEEMKVCQKASGFYCEWSPSGSPAVKKLQGLWPLGFWPWAFPRDSIHHYTPLYFQHIVPRVFIATSYFVAAGAGHVCLFICKAGKLGRTRSPEIAQ